MINKDIREQKLTPVTEVKVDKITYVSPDKERTRILFNGTIDGVVTVYGLTYIEVIKEGKEIHFISLPSRKGSNGEYYNVIRAYFPNEVVEDVLVQIEKALQE